MNKKRAVGINAHLYAEKKYSCITHRELYAESRTSFIAGAEFLAEFCKPSENLVDAIEVQMGDFYNYANNNRKAYYTLRKEFAIEIAKLIPTKPDPKTFDIDCAGNAMLRVEITDNVPTVLCAMNGYGNAMEVPEFIITPVKPDEAKEADPKVIPKGSFRCSRCGKATRELERAWKPFTDMCIDCAPF